jgi:hypothetical protein
MNWREIAGLLVRVVIAAAVIYVLLRWVVPAISSYTHGG